MSGERLTDEEWLRRYNQRFKDAAELEGDYSDHIDADVADLRESFEDDPEGAADEEMSYWND